MNDLSFYSNLANSNSLECAKENRINKKINRK